MFDPGMLPEPPIFKANRERVKVLESILEQAKQENTYLEKLVGKGKVKSIRDEVQKEAKTVCQGKQGKSMNFCHITHYHCIKELTKNTTHALSGFFLVFS